MLDFFKERAEDFQNYVGIRASALGLFVAAAGLAAAASTGVYWAVFGVKHWNTEMTTAGRILTAAATRPLAAPAAGAARCGQYVCPVHGAVGLPRLDASGVPRCPVGGEVMQFVNLAPVQPTPAAFAGG